MERLFIDESGSMTATHCNVHPYFVIAIIRAKKPEQLKKVYKRFVRKNMDKLKEANSQAVAEKTKGSASMFKNNKFSELKGNCFTPQLKRDFINFFCENDLFEIFYIIAYNAKVAQHNNGKLYDNTARAFNYLLKIALKYFITNGYIDDKSIIIQLDERNEKTETKHFLENYLNTELYLEDIMQDECSVSYFDSSNNNIIQIADVFANIMYSELRTGNYTNEIDKIKNNGYIKKIFKFPLK